MEGLLKAGHNVLATAKRYAAAGEERQRRAETERLQRLMALERERREKQARNRHEATRLSKVQWPSANLSNVLNRSPDLVYLPKLHQICSNATVHAVAVSIIREDWSAILPIGIR